MMRFFCVLNTCALGAALSSVTLAADLDSNTSIRNYHAWSEPTVQNWIETNQLLQENSSEHTDHSGMNMNQPSSTAPTLDDKNNSQQMPDMPGMSHEGHP